MIDFIRIFYNDKGRLEKFVLDENNFKDVNAVYGFHTSEIKYPYTTKLGYLDIGVSQKSGYVKNSIHKFHNFLKTKNPHNYNDFGYYSICNTIDFIIEKIIDMNVTKLTQLEIGFNLEIEKAPESVIMRNFLIHQYGGGSLIDYKIKGKLKQFVHGNYIIKIYDKGKQNMLSTNILRFEIKFTKAIEFRHLGAYYITDLKRKVVLRKLFMYLIKRFDDITIVDDFSNKTISNKSDYNKLRVYTNPIFWSEEIKHTHSEYKARHKRVFERLLIKNNLLKTKHQLRRQLFNKFIQLINN